MTDSTFKLTTPVAFIIFNRPDTTKRVFEAIREAKPEKLYLISDAPREGREDDEAKVAETRAYVEEHIDWECQVKKNYATENMGCKMRVSSGITWVLEQEEDTIILEDDVLPNQDFFRYCQEMLEKYKIQAVAIGNGTASRETEEFFRKVSLPDGCKVWVVSEDGASIYSASEVARKEFPDEDVTVRGAVSIGRRLMDPLAELVLASVSISTMSISLF